MKTVAIINLKGGVGKTMTAIHMADILASDYGQRVLLADCDGQGNLTAFFQADTECVTLADILAAQHEPYWIDNVQETGIPGVRLIPATSDLYGLDIAAIRRGSTSLGILRDFRDAVIEDGEEDWFIFDCPPGFTAASCAALLAADFVVVPVLIDGFSTAGMTDLLEQIASLRVVNPAIRVGGVLITQYRTSQAVQAGASLLRASAVPVYDTAIRRSERVPEMSFGHEPLRLFSPRSAACVDYRRWVAELLEKEGGITHGKV